MVLDQELLTKARTSAAHLSEAERKLQTSRAEYHTVIRRLHLAGASFREIAQELAISHQRVQQIVEAAGGSFWQRIWPLRKPARDTVCTFCERPPSELASLLAGPNIFACDECIAGAEKTLRSSPAGGWIAGRGRVACSFCAKRRAEDRPIVSHIGGNICAECLKVSRQILDDRATTT